LITIIFRISSKKGTALKKNVGVALEFINKLLH